MLYVVVEYYKRERCGALETFGSKSEAEDFIEACFSDETMGLFDYKTTFTIEEVEDECAP